MYAGLWLGFFIAFGIYLIESSATVFRSITIETPDDYKYLTPYRFRMCLNAEQVLQFHVKACHDAHIALMSGLSPNELMYEVVIDSSTDNATVIRRRKEFDIETVTKQNNGTFLQCGQFVYLLIQIDEDEIFIQRANDMYTIIKSEYRDMLPPIYVTVSTGFGAIGTWSFMFQHKGESPNAKNFQNIRLCPINLTRCSLEQQSVVMTNSDKCRSKFGDITLTCLMKTKDNIDAIYLQYSRIDTPFNKCEKEIIVMTGCRSDEGRCRSCKVSTVFEKDITNEYTETEGQIFLMNDTSCNFYDEWNMYITVVHIVYAPNGTKYSTSMSASSISSPVSATVSYANESFENNGSSNRSTVIGLLTGIAGILLILVVLSGTILIVKQRHNNTDKKERSRTTTFNNRAYYTGTENTVISATNYVHANSVDNDHIYHEIESSNDRTASSYDYIDIPDPQCKSKLTNDDRDPVRVPVGSKTVQAYDIVIPSESDQNEIDINLISRRENEINHLSVTSAMSKRLMVNSEAKVDRADSPYFALDPKETGFNRLQPTPPLYQVLDPDETGFNRSESMHNNAGVYELAKAIIDDSNTDDSKSMTDGRSMSNIGDGDHPRSDKSKEVKVKYDKNIYNHTIDNVYDSASVSAREQL